MEIVKIRLTIINATIDGEIGHGEKMIVEIYDTSSLGIVNVVVKCRDETFSKVNLKLLNELQCKFRIAIKMVSVNNLYVFGSGLSDGNVWRNCLKSCVNGVGDDGSMN